MKIVGQKLDAPSPTKLFREHIGATSADDDTSIARHPRKKVTRTTALAASVLVVAAGFVPAAAQEAAERLQRAIGLPLPSGPYSSWPQEDRESIIRSLFGRCSRDNASSFGRGYQGPEDAYREYWEAQTFACMVRKMPTDWPLLAQARREAQAHYEVARSTDPKVPPLELQDK